MSRDVPEDRIRNRADYRAFLAADLAAHDLASWHFFLQPKYPELHYQRVLRRVEYLQTLRALPARLHYALARVRLARLAVRTGLSVPPGVFGRGLSIAHCGSVVVNDHARVGTYCRIHSGTNLGIHRGGAPTLGDRVYLAPGAVLFGDIRIGDDVVVGANSVVTCDVPDGVTVAGAPARVIGSADAAQVLPGWFPSLAEAQGRGGGR